MHCMGNHINGKFMILVIIIDICFCRRNYFQVAVLTVLLQCVHNVIDAGMSFTNYLIQKRIEKSKELIRTTDMKVYEISYKVGYDTAAYFSTAFRKITGISPSDYKKLKS